MNARLFFDFRGAPAPGTHRGAFHVCQLVLRVGHIGHKPLACAAMQRVAVLGPPEGYKTNEQSSPPVSPPAAASFLLTRLVLADVIVVRVLPCAERRAAKQGNPEGNGYGEAGGQLRTQRSRCRAAAEAAERRRWRSRGGRLPQLVGTRALTQASPLHLSAGAIGQQGVTSADELMSCGQRAGASWAPAAAPSDGPPTRRSRACATSPRRAQAR